MVSRDPPGPHFGVVLETQSLHYTDSHESPCKYTLIHANPHVNTDARPVKPDSAVERKAQLKQQEKTLRPARASEALLRHTSNPNYNCN